MILAPIRMPRPTTKQDLLTQSSARFDALNDFIDGLTPRDRDREFLPGTMNRNIRDVLGHLYHWQKLMLDWYVTGKKGDQPAMPAAGYTWADTPALNRWIHAQYAAVPLTKVRKLLRKSHDDVMAIIESHSDAELFTKRRHAWTGSTSLGAYLVSCTSSHYDWALKLMRKGLR
jgi:hypothetical protein